MAIFKGQKDQITVPVIAELLTDNNRIMKVPFRATFKKLRAHEIEELSQRQDAGFESHASIVSNNIVGWHDLPDEHDNPVDFNESNLAELLEHIEYRLALYQAFLNAQYGRKVVNAKN